MRAGFPLGPLPFRRHQIVLPNGLRVVTVELPHLHTVSVVMYAKVGSRYEGDPATAAAGRVTRDNGLSHFLEHMLFRGTERLPDAYRLNCAIESIGGTLYAETGRDYSLYQISLHPDALEPGIALFGEIFCTPTFSELDVERRIVLEELLEDVDEEGRLVNIDDLARQAVWPDHPLGWRITGPVENVERFTRRDVRRHFGRYYGARNMVLCVSGAVRASEVERAVKRAMRALPSGEPIEMTSPPESQRRAQFQFVESGVAGPQTSAQLLFRALPEHSPLYPSLMMLSRIVDDGMSTRLHRRLCDELGLAYYVSASLEPFVDTGLFEMDAQAHHANVPALVRESLRIAAELRERLPTRAELDKARRRHRWDLERSFDDADAMAGWWGGTELFYRPLTYEEKLERVAKVTPASVREAARAVFRPERLTVTCVGGLSRKLAAEVARVVDRFS
jgi:predicted Zn-dependent peptidase